ncbi:hypothetical protein BD626DRAFT_423253 [Schizophyllum amplum]|uniref:Riboflavin kinase n=1 Tax=Schizophyllum amplum TaxID=97359 RepID=A0A550D054_9AGAR|nr:hypothetical protein BD626DRAFT_423253 [Auriculariopsis ampla]
MHCRSIRQFRIFSLSLGILSIRAAVAPSSPPSNAPNRYQESIIPRYGAYQSNPMATTRPLLIGPSTGPEAPYPLRMEGKVIRGFGRGSKELGIPTANLPVDASLTPWIADIKSGVYFGWASLRLPPSHPNRPSASSEARSGLGVYPMVMSIGYNPVYKNMERSAEVHVLHEFGADFYGVDMRLLLTGFIREEKNYPALEALIEDIKIDCDVARNSLDRESWALRKAGKGTLDGSWLVRVAVEKNL